MATLIAHRRRGVQETRATLMFLHRWCVTMQTWSQSCPVHFRIKGEVVQPDSKIQTNNNIPKKGPTQQSAPNAST
eukprot:6182885-Amphidinium_carterae.1